MLFPLSSEGHLQHSLKYLAPEYLNTLDMRNLFSMKTTFVLMLIVCTIGLVLCRSVAEDDYDKRSIDDIEQNIREKRSRTKAEVLLTINFKWFCHISN